MLQQIIDKQGTTIAASPIGTDNMVHLLIITEENKTAASLQANLDRNGFACSIASYETAPEAVARQSPNLVLVEVSSNDNAPVWGLIGSIKKGKSLPIIALITEENLDSLDSYPGIDDFIVFPYNAAELSLRINRLLRKTGDSKSSEQIKCNGLTIDLATCEVTVDGKKADLTFKEYELLKLMASNKGRVFTREALLDKIWGYDYYGGDRTVDVHMRRLRSKIEDVNHTYIETVRNIGYRFIKDNQP
jgi:DNA-binding response OmpR family regulator